MAEIIGKVIAWLINLLPAGNLEGLSAAIDGIVPYIKTGLYFLPVRTISQIFTVILAFWTYRLVVRIVKTIWDLIPFV